MFICNGIIKAFRKRKNNVESSTSGSELVALRIARDLIFGLWIKLKSIGAPLKGPMDVYFNNQGVVNNRNVPKSTLNKNHNSINYHIVCKAAEAGILGIGKEDTDINLADLLTELMP